MTDKRKNILVIQCDQLTVSALSFYGNGVVKAPNIDSIAADGTVFTSAYCNSPLCAPSRFSMMSGRQPSRIDAFDNGSEFRGDIPTFAHYLRSHGYQTVLAGKMHFVGGDQMHGFERRLTTDIYPADHGWTPDWRDPHRRIDWWYHNMDSVIHAGHNERANQIDFDDEVGYVSRRHLYDMARADDDRPFCMVVSFTNPHDPYTCPKEHWDRYDHAEIDMPRVAHMPYEDLDPHSRRLRHAYGMDSGAMKDEHILNARHAYYGQIAYLDDKIGLLLKALDDTGMRENTVILFISDHGDMLGERGLWYKMSMLEGSVRVPFVVNQPGQTGQRRIATPVSLVDLLPTMLDIAGHPELAEITDELDGRSVMSLCADGAPEEDRSVISEYMGEGAAAPIVMIRDPQYKYIHCPLDPPQLYDMQADPHELTNLAADPAYADMVAAFQARVDAHVDVETLHRAVLDSQKHRRTVFKAHMTGEHSPWDYQPPGRAHTQYMRNHLDLNDVESKGRLRVREG